MQVFDSPHVKILVGKRTRRRLDASSIVQLVRSFDAPAGILCSVFSISISTLMCSAFSILLFWALCINQVFISICMNGGNESS